MPCSTLKTERNLFFRLAYDGTDYAGWQVQPNAITVQREFVSGLERLWNRKGLEVFGSSRTDSGVHALDQCVTFRPDPDPPIPINAIHRALHGILPPTIRVQSVEDKPPRFHARHSNVGKAYTYLIHRGPILTPFLSRYMLQMTYPLDVDRMCEASAFLLGEHDFVAFTVALKRQSIGSTIRRLTRIYIREHGDTIAITIIGPSFMYKMVRCIVGYLLDVGRDRLPPDTARKVFESGTSEVQAQPAPAHGLFLERVFYDEAEYQSFEPGPLPFDQLCDH